MAPIFLGTDALGKAVEANEMALTDGNKTADKTTTIFKVKSRDGKNVAVQFGKSMEDWVRCTVVNYTDLKDDTKTKRVVFANVEEDPAVADDIRLLMEYIGRKLYEGREAYWGGRVKDSMDFDEFMTRCSVLIKKNRLTDADEVILKSRDATKVNPGSKFWHVSDLKKDEEKGTWKLTKRPIAKFASTARTFRALITCTVGVFTGYNKGPTWGVFLTVAEACMQPMDTTDSAAAAADASSMVDFFGAAEVDTQSEVSMVVDAVEGDRVAEPADLLEEVPKTPPKLKRSNATAGMAPGFVPSKRQTK